MKSIDNDAALDDYGQLYLTRPGTPGRWDPPGTEPPPVLVATGYTYEIVPTYGWPLGVIYLNNPLQFASAATAAAMLALVQVRFGSYQARLSLDEVKVGPFTRKPIRKITVSDGQGVVAILNAGELANQYARYPEGWQAQVARTIRDGVANRDREE